MIDKLDFSIIMDIIKIIGVASGILVMIKQRSEVIIAKFKQRQAEDKANEAEAVVKRSEEKFNFIAETLLDVVQASKMDISDKKKAMEGFLKINKVIPEIIKSEEVTDVVKDVVEAVEEIKGISSGIIKRD